MAITEFGSADVVTIKRWARLTFRDVIRQTYFARFMGLGPMAAIQRLTDLEKEPGDQIKYDLLIKMSQYGVEGSTPMKGAEEKLTYEQDSVTIDQRRIGHAWHRNSQQKTHHQLRMDGRQNLSMRWSEFLDQTWLAQMAGRTGDLGYQADAEFSAAAQHAGNAFHTVDANHLLDKTTEVFQADHIDFLVEKLKTVSPPIRPLKIEGREYYVLFIHPRQVTDLRTSASTKWWDTMRDAGLRGPSNPVFTGALGVWNGIIMHESNYLPIVTGAPDVCDAILLGAQSSVLALGNAYSRLDQQKYGRENMLEWAERSDDYGEERGLAGGLIYGMKPSTFKYDGTNNERFGSMVLRTDAAAHV
jgi:N4-gp56 family major capsid protein